MTGICKTCGLPKFSDMVQMQAQLASSQARETKLRDELSGITGWLEQGVRLTDDEHEVNWNRGVKAKYQSAIQALALPTDDTALKEALKQAKREALLEAAEWLDDGECDHKWKAEELRRMAEEIDMRDKRIQELELSLRYAIQQRDVLRAKVWYLKRFVVTASCPRAENPLGWKVVGFREIPGYETQQDAEKRVF